MPTVTATWMQDGKVRTYTDQGDGTMLIQEFAPGDAGYADAAALVISSPHHTPDAEPTMEQHLAAARASAIDRVNRATGLARRAFITDLPAQVDVYQEKEGEARTYLTANPEPSDLDGFYWIPGEVGVTGTTPYEVAQVYANMAAIYRLAASEFDSIRLTALRDIEASDDFDEIETIASAAMTGIRTALAQWGVT